MIETTYKNAYGITIKKCCASCKHHRIDNETHRICLLGYGAVRPSFLCGDCYSMIEEYEKAGKGDGFVKKKHYFRYITDFKQPENPKFRFSIDDIRREYEKEYGSVFIDNKPHKILNTKIVRRK